MSYLSELNEAQRQAVVYNDGPSLVIAGAGSGKTRVLTYKIAHLIKTGIPAQEILALTFTNKAAREMKERIVDIVGASTARHLWMGTFHSIFARILRKEAASLGYTSNYIIYDTADSKSALKSIINDLKLDEKVYKPNEVLSRISSAKNNLVTVDAYKNNMRIIEADQASRRPLMAEIYAIYTRRCKAADAMDFDDLLLNTNILFRDFPEILKTYQQQFSHILVDEYQDTNYSQYLIVKKLSEAHQKLCVV